MKPFKSSLVVLLISLLVLLQCNCEETALNDAGIQISFTEESFTNIFDGLSTTLQQQINDKSFEIQEKYAALKIKNINLTQFQINKTSSKTTFLSDNKMRVLLNFQTVNITFAYKILALNFIPIFSGNGFIEDSNLRIAFDVSISANPNGTTHFSTSHFDIVPGRLTPHFSNKLISAIMNFLFNCADFLLSTIKSILNISLNIIVNKIGSAVNPLVSIPSLNAVLDLSIQAKPFIQNGYMNIPISGNSYARNSTIQQLNPYHEFNPQQYQSNSSQIFIDQKVINRLIETVVQNEKRLNITLPQEESSTTPVDSRSLSPVFPGLKQLTTVHYPIIEIILNKDSIKFQFQNNLLNAKLKIGMNLYMQGKKKNIINDSTGYEEKNYIFKYNNDIVYLTAELNLNILNSRNYLTVNLVDIDLQNVITSQLDQPLVDAQQIISLFPIFNQIVHDAVNLETYQYYLDLSKLLGFPIEKIDINFDNHNIHLGLIF